MSANDKDRRLIITNDLKGSALNDTTKIETSTAIIKPNILPFPVRLMEQELSPVTSLLGNTVYSNLFIEGGTYVDPEGTEQIYPTTLYDTVVITVSQTKNIVTTPIQGRNGTVKEYISDGDYEVTISITISDVFNNQYPKAEVESLLSALKANDSISVDSDFLSYLGITDLVVTNYSIPQIEGVVNQQKVIINAISDEPFEVRLNRDANS